MTNPNIAEAETGQRVADMTPVEKKIMTAAKKLLLTYIALKPEYMRNLNHKDAGLWRSHIVPEFACNIVTHSLYNDGSRITLPVAFAPFVQEFQMIFWTDYEGAPKDKYEVFISLKTPSGSEKISERYINLDGLDENSILAQLTRVVG